ncbi:MULTISPECIES: HlyD family secretion protein [Thermodesulfovibrio]|uniref:HlyD family secretion protein, putative n=1 Tax=Thermodesulfovibrio yellowstonii (strain ATCC 51303 / DSM 11347 / YP87) TaxID=289376 RepID=B5YGH4_THEYD|nr:MULTISPECIES: efflux RND transporter periplasmic adaptor subunit [Thermodesulfovibrio]ACI20812.1 HlyD family secretion protein, putative [Thermodesulfovibrio yellowstonii DSM 11347]ACI22179.1 HlyD family secretion protein, putative [Thermodesulfovibrio yellowstonii DSM 11347]
MKINLKKLLIVFVILIFIFSLVYIVITKTTKFPEGLIILSGRIEGRETNISPKIQGRITKLYKDEGDTARQEELLCEIDSEQLTARYRNAVETAQAYYSSIAQARANLIKAQASYEKAKKDYDRYSSLLKEELVSKSDFDRVKMQYESAQAEVEAAVKAITQAESSYRAAEQRIKEAQADLNETKIYSPAGGVILSRPVEVGEVVNPGTVLYVMVDLNKLYVKVYIPEPEIGKLKIGLPARVYIDAYPDKYFNGKITKIYEQAEFTPKNVETKEERVKLVFGVEVSVENPEGLLKPGMPADVVIKWKDDAPWIKPR